jgi:octaprenyl-diphosphate synthase
MNQSATRFHAISTPATPVPGPYDRLAGLLAADLHATNEVILTRMQSRVALIPQLAGYLIAAGGKRLRPLLTLATASLCGYHGTRHHNLAACVEFIHTATLLHDDVVDDSDMRRGQKSANAIYGNEASVLVGDFLFSRAFELMVADGSLEVLRILSSASATIAEGEVMQLAAVNDLSTSEETYLEVIRGKTAALFAAACEVGGVVAGRPKPEVEALRAYGLNLGIAFQLTDDVLDYSAVQAKLGKEVGNDFREGKMTLPVLLAYQAGTSDEQAFWQRTMAERTQSEGDLLTAQQLLQKHQTLDEAVNRARMYGDAAKVALDGFAPSEMHQILVDLVDFVVSRDY